MRKTTLTLLIILIAVTLLGLIWLNRTGQSGQETSQKTPQQIYASLPSMSSSEFFKLVSKCQATEMAYTNQGFQFRSTVDNKVYAVGGRDVSPASVGKALVDANAANKCGYASPSIE